MREIIGLFTASIFLFGFNYAEEKVTPEMLVGDWTCDVSTSEAKWKNGLFQDGGVPTADKIRLIFKIEDEEIVSQIYGHENFYRFLQYYVYEAGGVQDYKGVSGRRSKIISDISFTSKNSFNMTTIREETNDEDPSLNSHVTIKSNCTRTQ